MYLTAQYQGRKVFFECTMADTYNPDFQAILFWEQNGGEVKMYSEPIALGLLENIQQEK